MYLKLLQICVIFSTIRCVRGRSFTIIIDVTNSMADEIDVIRRHLPSNVLKNATNFENFILVPFDDPGAGTPLISSSPEQLLDSLDSLTISGGDDCPEASLSGIQKGLEISKPESLIYVFTDAYSNDKDKFRDVETLCRSSRSQVVVFLSGNCPSTHNRARGSVQVYYDVAKVCSGAVFRFDAVSLRKAFNYVEEMVKSDWNNIVNYEPFMGAKIFSVTTDTFTNDLLIAVSGDNPSVQITDSEGNSLQMQSIVDTRQSLVVRILRFNPGVYQVKVFSQSTTSLTLYKSAHVPFEYGFSTRWPRTLRETSLRPIPGWLNYILIVMSPTYNIQITSVDLLMTDMDQQISLAVNETETQPGYYYSRVFMEPDRSFKCVIHGRNAITYEQITGSTKIVDVQKPVEGASWSEPIVEIIELDNNLPEYGANTTVACKVTGYPTPEIEWEQDPDSMIAKEVILLEMPSTYISYVTVNSTSNSTLYCKAKNAKGDYAQSISLFVNRTFKFEVVERPSDNTFEYGSEARLICHIDAYPEAEIRWSHNDTLVDSFGNIELVPEEHALVIKNMSLDDVGLYKCEANNSVSSETFDAEINISGLEAPEVEIENSEIILQSGDSKHIECRIVKGSPKPQITWFYSSNNEYFDSVLPSDIIANEEIINVKGKMEYKGVYKCVATNVLGEHEQMVSVKIQYAPVIADFENNNVVVIEENMVELPCSVDAVPKATVRWEMTRDDIVHPLEDRQNIDHRNTLRFAALWKDSGNYHCIAENHLGTTEKIVSVNVLVPPFIEQPAARIVQTTVGSQLNLNCHVLYGNPSPNIVWIFTNNQLETSTISSGTGTSLRLNLANVNKENDGAYLCVADNSVGNDRIQIIVRVK